MADHVLAKPDPLALDNFLRAQAQSLRANDEAPADRKVWEQRRAGATLRVAATRLSSRNSSYTLCSARCSVGCESMRQPAE